MSADAESSALRTVGVALLLAVAVLALWLRTVQVTESLWLDELHTAWVVADGVEHVAERATIGNQSPLYFWLVWATAQAAGLNEIALRLPSIVAGVSLVLLAFYVTWRWTNQWAAALFVALLVALDRDCIFYAQEARPYAWVQLLGLAHVYSFSSLVYHPDRVRRLVMVFLTALLFYIHYTSILLLAAELVFYAILQLCRAWRPAYAWRQLLVDLLLVLLCLLPASRHVWEIAARRENWELFIRRRPLFDIWYLFPLYVYLQLPVLILVAGFFLRGVLPWLGKRCASFRAVSGSDAAGELQSLGKSADADVPSPLATPRSGGGEVTAGESSSSARMVSDPRLFLLTGCWLFVTLLAAWFLTYLDVARLFFLRYVIIAALAPIVLAGLCFALCPSRLLRVVCLAAVVWMSVAHSGIVPQYRRDGRVIGDRNQDWRSAIAAINAALADHAEPVFVRSGLIEAAELRSSGDPQLRQYCLLPVLGIYRLECDTADLVPLPIHRSGHLSPRQRQRIEEAGGAWFLLAGLPDTISSIRSELLANWPGAETRVEVVECQAYGYVTVLRLKTAVN